MVSSWFTRLQNHCYLVLRGEVLLHLMVLSHLKWSFEPWLVRKIRGLVTVANQRLILDRNFRTWDYFSIIIFYIFILLFLKIGWSSYNFVLRILRFLILQTLLYPCDILNFWFKSLFRTTFAKDFVKRPSVLLIDLFGERFRCNIPPGLRNIIFYHKGVSTIRYFFEHKYTRLPNDFIGHKLMPALISKLFEVNILNLREYEIQNEILAIINIRSR